MIVFLDDGFEVEVILKELLEEQKTQPKCGYFQLRLVSAHPTVNYLRLYCNDVTKDFIKNDLIEIKKEITKLGL